METGPAKFYLSETAGARKGLMGYRLHRQSQDEFRHARAMGPDKP